jgi:hypothetical protein
LPLRFHHGEVSTKARIGVRIGGTCARSRHERGDICLFGPGLIRTEVWSRDGVLLQTASRHSHPVGKYGLCGTRLINNYFVETNRSMVVRRRCTRTMSRQSCPADIDGCSVRVMSSTVCILGRVQDLDPVASTICTPLGVMARQEDLGV